MSYLVKLIGTVALIYVLIAGFVYTKQRSLMFAASTERIQPASIGLNEVDEITLHNTDGEQLHSWYGKASTNKPTILYLHGNGGSISSRSDIQREFLRRGYGIFMVGYPGYGGSEGSPSEVGLLEAAEIAHSHLREAGVSSEDLILFGESLGSSVAIQLAAKTESNALVLAAPMYSISEIAQSQYPYLPIAALLKDPFLSFKHMAKVEEPLVIFHGSEDQAIPSASSKKLFALANKPKHYQLVAGAGHNNLFDFGILDTMELILEKHVRQAL